MQILFICMALLSCSWKDLTRCMCSCCLAWWWWLLYTKKMQFKTRWLKMHSVFFNMGRKTGSPGWVGAGWPQYWPYCDGFSVSEFRWYGVGRKGAMKAPWGWLCVLEQSCRASVSSAPWRDGGGSLRGDLQWKEKWKEENAIWVNSGLVFTWKHFKK